MKYAYGFFILGIILDAIILPAAGAAHWLPRFSLAILPLLFLAVRNLALALAVTTLMLWLVTASNIGVILLGLGSAAFFVRWAVPRMFHPETWQAHASAALSVLIFGAVVYGIEWLTGADRMGITMPQAVGLLLAALVGGMITLVAKPQGALHSYEEKA